ncbi:MAG: neutral/alkaline non-lysosomal ceramidase N-terminal domain-containing protein [Chloroflexota bacterium]
MNGLVIGLGKVDVTPPLDIPYLSYYPRQTPFEGVHDRLYARALAAELVGDDGAARRPAERAAIVAVDSLGFSRTVLGPGRDFIAEVRARIAQRTGIPAANVLIAATHAHSTPQTTDLAPLVEQVPAAAGWLERLIDQLAAAVAVAWTRRAPAELRGATGLAPGIAWCRRIITRDGRIVRFQHRPADAEALKEPRDDRVPVLLVSGPAGRTGATGATWRGALMGFTCHPTTVQVRPLVSADYPGVACAIVERELEADACLFLQGACGNVGPIRATTDFQDVAVYGRSLAGEALRALSLLEARDAPPMRPALAIGSEMVEVERRPLPHRATLERKAAGLAGRIAQATTDEARREAIAAYRRVAEPLRLTQLGEAPVRIEVQALRLGEALIIACEGELFVEFGNRIKDASPARITFVAAYSNGYEGYLPTPETFDEGGYEASVGPWTRVWRAGGERVTERAIALAHRVWET